MYRTPYVDRGEPMPQQAFGFVRHKITHALGSGFDCVIIVHAQHRPLHSSLAALRSGTAAHRMVGKDNLGGTHQFLYSALELSVIKRSDLIIVIKIRCARRKCEDLETSLVKRDIFRSMRSV